MIRSQLKLGEILLREGIVTDDQLQKAIQVQKSERGRIGEVLVRLGLAEEKDIALALAKQLGIPYASLSKGLLSPQPDQGLEQLVPEDFARRYFLIPLSKNLNSLTVALADPIDLLAIDNLRRVTGCEVNPIVATHSDIQSAIDAFYGKQNLLQEAISRSYGETEKSEVLEKIHEEDIEERGLSLDRVIQEAEEAPVVKLVDLLIKQAIEDGASDIHIEPFEKRISIRYRIDGVLYEISPPSAHLLLPLISRLKILAHMDIAEKRLPQDGGFIVRMQGRMIDMRVSAIPMIYGEKIVIRVLDKSRTPLDLGQLGFNQKDLEKFRSAIHSPYGLVFLTGPTGSGKTTTLYAALNELKSSETNIVTVEDPVEYRLEGVNQLQVRPVIGLTFATALRSFLRQDPDIIMVGEIRDLETARICVQASLTGHLVLSTLHTNDAVGAVGRMIDIGVEPYLLIYSLRLVAAQRLVRKLCDQCKEPYEAAVGVYEKIGLEPGVPLYKAKGCEKCRQTGYKGRLALYELFGMSEELQVMISKHASPIAIKEKARQLGMRTLFEVGVQKAREGLTSVEEVLRMTLEGE